MEFKEALKNSLIKLNNDISYLDFIDIKVRGHSIQYMKNSDELLEAIFHNSGSSIIKLPLEPKNSVTASFAIDVETINNNTRLIKIKEIGFIRFNSNFIKQYDINDDNYFDNILNDILKFYSIYQIQPSEIAPKCIKYNHEPENNYEQKNDVLFHQPIKQKPSIENYISKNEIQKNNKLSKSQINWIIAIAIIIILIIAGNIFHNSSNSDDNEAFVISQNFVKSALISPSTAKFPLLDFTCLKEGNQTYIIKSYVDSQNGFGAMVRNHYSVEIKFKGGDWADPSNWELININTW